MRDPLTRPHRSSTVHLMMIKLPNLVLFRSCLIPSILGLGLAFCLASGARAQEDESSRHRAKAEAIIMWTGLVIMTVFVLGVAMMWMVMRTTRRTRHKHETKHTDMPDIWYLNPPEKRKKDGP